MSLFGLRLRESRKRRGWTQVRLAEASGVKVTTILDYEHGKPTHPRLANITAIAAALEIPICHLLADPYCDVAPLATRVHDAERLLTNLRADLDGLQRRLPHTGHPRIITPDERKQG